jgi:hypothetical protein
MRRDNDGAVSTSRGAPVRRLIRSFAWVGVDQVLSSLSSVIVAIAIARAAGAAGLGRYSVASGGGFGQPHNDYIRTYCDTGWLGIIGFWRSFVAAGVRSARLAVRGGDRQLHAGAGLLVLAFARTDNPMVNTAHFMIPLAIVIGLSDATYQKEREQRSRRAADPTLRAPASKPGTGARVLSRP